MVQFHITRGQLHLPPYTLLIGVKNATASGVGCACPVTRITRWTKGAKNFGVALLIPAQLLLLLLAAQKEAFPLALFIAEN